jgi:CubicO group peptidase (beta-lactamase class C family)
MDDTIATHLPDYPNKEVAGKITIQQLIDHRSGLGDIFTRRFADVSKSRFEGPKDFIAFFAADPLQFEPGTQQKYSNYGYVVLGAIVEAVSGQSYFDYIQKNVFAPTAMTGSGFFDLELPIPAGKLLNPEWTRWYFHGDPGAPGVYAGGPPGVNAVVASDATWTIIVLANVDPQLPEELGEMIFHKLTP